MYIGISAGVALLKYGLVSMFNYTDNRKCTDWFASVLHADNGTENC